MNELAMSSRHHPLRVVFLGAALFTVLAAGLVSAGCAYALQPAVPASQYRLKVAAPAPTLYSIRLRLAEPRDYAVPADGRVMLDVPAYRLGCKVYIFGAIKVRGGSSPFPAKVVDVSTGGRVVRQLSLKQVIALPVDPEGYHLLAIRPSKAR